jgi:Fe-S cluster assembly protein SufD
MSFSAVIERSRREKESWRYTDLAKLLVGFNFVDIIPSLTSPSSERERSRSVVENVSPQSPRLFFLNGVWQPGQSHLGGLPADIMQGDVAKGYRLTLAGQTCLVTQPVQLLFMTTQTGEINTQLYIELGASGRLSLIERHMASDHVVVHVMNTEITLHPQAKLVHSRIIEAGADAAHLALTKVHIAEGAYYDNFTLIKNSKLTRNEIDAKLTGKLAQCTLNGVMLLRGHEHADTTTRITHAAPHGISRQLYKTVLNDQAHGVFQGKIVVAEGAQKSDGHQLSRALLLSDQAEMNAKPELEIYADDVKCSHGSTIGNLDDDALFYLRTRGLNEAAGRALLVRAFIDEVVDEVHIDDARECARAETGDWLDEQG